MLPSTAQKRIKRRSSAYATINTTPYALTYGPSTYSGRDPPHPCCRCKQIVSQPQTNRYLLMLLYPIIATPRHIIRPYMDVRAREGTTIDISPLSGTHYPRDLALCEHALLRYRRREGLRPRFHSSHNHTSATRQTYCKTWCPRNQPGLWSSTLNTRAHCVPRTIQTLEGQKARTRNVRWTLGRTKHATYPISSKPFRTPKAPDVKESTAFIAAISRRRLYATRACFAQS